MAFTNYTSLQSTIADYLARSDLTSEIPDFISLAETRLSRDLRIRQMLKVATAPTVAGDSTVSLPADFLSMKDIHLDGNPTHVIDFQSTSNFFRNTRTTQAGVPLNYTLLGSEFQFAPIPDAAYTIRMVYFYKPPVLSDVNPSNVFLATCPDLLLYAALGEAEPYLMNDERLQTWSALYQRGVDSLTKSDDDAEFPAHPMSITLTTR